MVPRTYGRILAEVERLKRIGAVEKRGRPPANADSAEFRIKSRVWKTALSALPPAERSEWIQECKSIASELQLSRSDYAKLGAANRRDDITADRQLFRQTQANKKAKARRILAIKEAVIVLNTSGKRVTSKTVAKCLEQTLGLILAPDTIRKLLAQIRQGRPRV